MNTWQAVRQIKAVLEAAVWPDGSGGKVFGQVVATAGLDPEDRSPVRFPLARINVLALQADEESAGLFTRGFEVELTQRVEGDGTGQRGLIGGPRSGGQGASAGRGLLELEERLLVELGKAARAEGFSLRLDAASGVAAAKLPEVGVVSFAAWEFSGWVTRDRSYPEATRLAASDAGGQQVALTWRVPADRFDRLSLVLRRASGATAPATPADGDAVSVAGFASGVTDSPGVAGTYTYGLWVAYDETGGGSAERYSQAATATVVVA